MEIESILGYGVPEWVNCQTYSEIGGSQNTLGKKYALHIRDIQAPPNKSHMTTIPKHCIINLPGGHLCHFTARFLEIYSPREPNMYHWGQNSCWINSKPIL